MLGQSVIPKQIEEIKSKDRFLQVGNFGHVLSECNF